MNEKIPKWQKDIEQDLYAYLGAMNMLGVISGETTDSAIAQRDIAVVKIVKKIKKALESQMSDLRKEVESMRVPDIFGQKRNIQGETIDQVLLLIPICAHHTPPKPTASMLLKEAMSFGNGWRKGLKDASKDPHTAEMKDCNNCKVPFCPECWPQCPHCKKI